MQLSRRASLVPGCLCLKNTRSKQEGEGDKEGVSRTKVSPESGLRAVVIYRLGESLARLVVAARLVFEDLDPNVYVLSLLEARHHAPSPAHPTVRLRHSRITGGRSSIPPSPSRSSASGSTHPAVRSCPPDRRFVFPHHFESV